MRAIRITILDNDAKRIQEIDSNLFLAAKECGCTVITNSISEPPMLAREQLLDRVPVLEIENHYWSIKPQTVFTKDQCVSLIKQFIRVP